MSMTFSALDRTGVNHPAHDAYNDFKIARYDAELDGHWAQPDLSGPSTAADVNTASS
jgi:hypothetical protein